MKELSSTTGEINTHPVTSADPGKLSKQVESKLDQASTQAEIIRSLQAQVHTQSAEIDYLQCQVCSLHKQASSQQELFEVMQSIVIRQIISKYCREIKSSHDLNMAIRELRDYKIPLGADAINALVEHSVGNVQSFSDENAETSFCFDDIIRIQDGEEAMLEDYLAKIHPSIVTIETSRLKSLDQLPLLKNCKTFIEGKATSTECMTYLVSNMPGCRWMIDLSKPKEHICAVTSNILPNSSVVLRNHTTYAATELQHDEQQLKVCAMIDSVPNDVEIIIDKWISGYSVEGLQQMAQCIKKNAIVYFLGDSIAQTEALELLKNIKNKCTIGFNLAAIDQQTELVARSINDECLVKPYYSLDPAAGKCSSTASHRQKLSRKLMTIIVFKFNLGKATLSYDRLSLTPSDIASINSTLINMNKKLGQSAAPLSGSSSGADASSVEQIAPGLT